MMDSSSGNPQEGLLSGIVMWATLVVMCITLISIITIGFYTGDIKEWF